MFGTMLGFFIRPIRATEYFLPKYGISGLSQVCFLIMAAFAESMCVKLHKNDYSSHNPSRESTVGSWYRQQGLQKGSRSFS